MGECPCLQVSKCPSVPFISLHLHVVVELHSAHVAFKKPQTCFFSCSGSSQSLCPPPGENVPSAMNAAFLYLTRPMAVCPLTERPATVHRPLGTLILLLLLLFAKVKFRGSWAPLFFILLSVKHGGRQGSNITDISQKGFTAEIKRILSIFCKKLWKKLHNFFFTSSSCGCENTEASHSYFNWPVKRK